MIISARGVALIRCFESVRYKPYQCPALLWTVGVGHVIDHTHTHIPLADRRALPIPKGWNRRLTDDEVNAILAEDLSAFERGVLRLAPVLSNYQCAFDACVSFAFNVGLGAFQRSSLRMKLNRGDNLPAADAFLQWTKASGKVMPGLVRRRNAERVLFLESFT